MRQSDTYERDEYGSFKSTLRSAKFLQKVDSKLNSRIARLATKALPDLAAVCRSIKYKTTVNGEAYPFD